MNARATKTIIGLCALVAALLITRLLVLLFAARPDNAGIAVLLQVTQPLVWPLAWIDSAQPLYGARFERGTLIQIGLCWGISWLVGRQSRP